ncbi:MAG TPA: hypothetical protein VF128_13715 [Gemmatimonadaceae bacterium]
MKRQPSIRKSARNAVDTAPIAGVGNSTRCQRVNAATGTAGAIRESIGVWRTK